MEDGLKVERKQRDKHGVIVISLLIIMCFAKTRGGDSAFCVQKKGKQPSAKVMSPNP